MLKELYDNPNIYKELEEKTTYLKNGLDKIFADSKFDYRINHLGSMVSVFFIDVDVVDFDTASQNNSKLFGKFFHEMLKRGVYLPPSSYESYFLANSLTYEQLDHIIKAAKESLEEI